MPYTRNTRIKTTKYLYKKTSVAEVEYRYPLTNITKWVEFSASCAGWTIIFAHDNYQTTPFKAWWKSGWDKGNAEVKDEEFAKIVIDTYHKMLDEQEYSPVVEYTKYPD